MGGFVVKPLQEELAESCQHDRALADARRCLEVLVPLAYRPAIKVCCIAPFITLRIQLASQRLISSIRAEQSQPHCVEARHADASFMYAMLFSKAEQD